MIGAYANANPPRLSIRRCATVYASTDVDAHYAASERFAGVAEIVYAGRKILR